MIVLTLEALYTLSLFNDVSDNLAFLPLPKPEKEDRKAQLQTILDKGYRDLQKCGLLNGDEPTEDFIRLGYYINLYSESYYHFQVDSNYFCAPEVDEYKRMSVVIKQVDDNAYIVDYFNTIALLGILLKDHEVLHHLDTKFKNYLKSDWQPYAYMRLLAYYGRTKSIRIKVEQLGRIWQDSVFFNSKYGLFEYDLVAQQIKSVSAKEMRDSLVKRMKVMV